MPKYVSFNHVPQNRFTGISAWSEEERFVSGLIAEAKKIVADAGGKVPRTVGYSGARGKTALVKYQSNAFRDALVQVFTANEQCNKVLVDQYVYQRSDGIEVVKSI